MANAVAPPKCEAEFAKVQKTLTDIQKLMAQLDMDIMALDRCLSGVGDVPMTAATVAACRASSSIQEAQVLIHRVQRGG